MKATRAGDFRLTGRLSSFILPEQIQGTENFPCQVSRLIRELTSLRLRFVKRGGRDGLLMHFCGEAERSQVQSRDRSLLLRGPSIIYDVNTEEEGGSRKDVVRE